jgi:hypothetical protein
VEVEDSFFFRDTWAPFLDKYKYAILAGFLVFEIIFLVGACLITPTPLEIYTLFPPDSNFYSFTKLALTRFPGEANPLAIHLVFGLDVENPVEYGDMKATDFVPADDATGREASGTPNWDMAFDMSYVSFQEQLLDVCEVVHSDLGPEAKFSIQTQYGINPQLAGSETGVISAAAGTGKAYGIQCLIKGFEQFQDVPKTATEVTLDDESLRNSIKYDFDPAPEIDGVPSWIGDDDSVDTCRYCFNSLVVSEQVDQNVFVEGVVSDTSPVAEGCNCMGLFPVPQRICFSEFENLDKLNPFKCLTSNMFFDSLTKYLETGGNQQYWRNYVYAQKDENNKFSRIAMTEITVQTGFDIFSTDAWKGLEMVEAWEDWAEQYVGRTNARQPLAQNLTHRAGTTQRSTERSAQPRSWCTARRRPSGNRPCCSRPQP